jgi:hypothetical protein
MKCSITITIDSDDLVSQIPRCDGGTKLEITLDFARELHKQLNHVFGKEECAPNPFYTPRYAPMWVDETPKPFSPIPTITCSNYKNHIDIEY